MSKELLQQAVEALKGLIPQTFTGTPSRETLVAYWQREKVLGRGEAGNVLAAFAALTALESALQQQEAGCELAAEILQLPPSARHANSRWYKLGHGQALLEAAALVASRRHV